MPLPIKHSYLIYPEDGWCQVLDNSEYGTVFRKTLKDWHFYLDIYNSKETPYCKIALLNNSEEAICEKIFDKNLTLEEAEPLLKELAVNYLNNLIQQIQTK